MTINFAMSKLHVCECGLCLVVGRPEDAEVLGNLVRDGGEGYSLMLLGEGSAACPKCGMMYHLPPPETFDVERHGMASIYGMVKDLEENAGKTNYPPPEGDIPF